MNMRISEIYGDSLTKVKVSLNLADIDWMFIMTNRAHTRGKGDKSVGEYRDWLRKYMNHLPSRTLHEMYLEIKILIDGNPFFGPIKEERDIWFDLASEMKAIINVRKDLFGEKYSFEETLR